MISIFILLVVDGVPRLSFIFQSFDSNLLYVCYECIVEKKKTKSFYAAKIVSFFIVISVLNLEQLSVLSDNFTHFILIFANIGESIKESKEPYVVLGVKVDPQDAWQE